MSEDDAELGPDGQSTSRIDRDRRAPRFSWTPAYETTFFRSLCSSVQLGFRENSSFKTEAWERAAKALEECHSAFPTKSHLINKSDNARKRFRLWRGLRENPDFEYNSSTKTVTASEAAWKAHIEKEPLSRALRGRPFDHEEYMEILYPDVVGSGGAPKRVKRRRRRTEGMARDDSEMPEPDVLQLQTEHATSQSSPRLMRSSSGLRQATLNRTAGLRLMPTATALARRAAPSSEKRQRTSTAGDSVARISASSSNILSDTAMAHPPTWCELALEQFFSDFADESMELQIKIAENVLIHENKAMIFCKMPRRLRQHWTSFLRHAAIPVPSDNQHELGQNHPPTAVSLFNPHLLLTSQQQSERSSSQTKTKRITNNRIFPHTDILLLFIMSYADVAASGPKQTPEEAAAPQPAEIVNTESVATASPLDVDIRSVHTVPSDFSEISEQPIRTEPQANRLDFKTEADVEAEAEAAKTTKAKDKAKDKVQNAKKQTETKARETDSWLVQQFSGLSDGSASALAVTNLVAIIGVSSYLGYKAWGLYERGNLSWKTAGVGVGILAGVGTAEAVLGRYLYKGKKGGS